MTGSDNQPPKSDYVPALRFHWLTPLYDTVLRLFLRERYFKSLLIDEAELAPGQRVLDFGCGTGTLSLMLKRACPEAEVHGLDIDPKALGIAQGKAASEGAEIAFHQGSVAEPPDMPGLEPGSFDRVVTSLVFHHLTRDDKARALVAALGLLKPGGRFLIADWGKAANPVMRGAFYLVQMLDGFATTGDNVKGMLPGMIREAGFADLADGPVVNTAFGTLAMHMARKPG